MAKPKILLVDDTKLVLELAKSMLKLSPVEILTAGDGVEALEVVRKELPDMIFMDINMPRMGGIECCSILKADPFLCSIPIVMLTTVGSEDYREQCRLAGCDDYMTKPIDRVTFLSKARRFVDIIERREPRVQCRLPLIFRTDNVSGTGLSFDISDDGLFVATDHELRENAPLELAFFLPSSPGVVAAKGRVVWLNGSAEPVNLRLPAGFGVQFLDIAARHLDLIREYISERKQQ
jgi:uncharacterized protein (TIGR02266 family)